MKMTNPVSGPHTHGPASVSRIMMTVILALVPATIWSLYQFGWPAVNLFAITILSAVAIEAACVKLAGKPVMPSLTDGSGILSAWLLAMSLPPWAPWWIGVMGAVCAILLGKQVFGGLGQNVFNPAMLARVILLISFPVQMTAWVNPVPMFSEQDPGFVAGLATTFNAEADWDSISTASPMGHLKTELTLKKDAEELLAAGPSWGSAAIGTISGSMGETSALLLLLGGLWLVFKGIIKWQAPAAMMVTVAVMSLIFYLINPHLYAPPSFHLLSGGLILAAFFIITDPVTSPNTIRGQIIFGAGCGLMTYVIRTWGGYPEGIGFAVLLMNACTPLIDHYLRPRIYGRTAKGQPLPVESKTTQEEQS